MSDLALLDAIGHDGIKRIRSLRRTLHRVWKTKRICKIISSAIKHEFGLRVAVGVRSGREHWWNLLPDGTIVDASADQFGGRGIAVFGSDDDGHAMYEAKSYYWE